MKLLIENLFWIIIIKFAEVIAKQEIVLYHDFVNTLM